MRIGIINGPSLNLLGTREPEIYGSTSFEDYLEDLKSGFSKIELEYFQSNVEGEIINKLQGWSNHMHGIILNAAGYSHTSVAIADAISAIKTPVVEVHISNIFAREDYRHYSLTGARCKGTICGLGLEGYKLAIQFFVDGKL